MTENTTAKPADLETGTALKSAAQQLQKTRLNWAGHPKETQTFEKRNWHIMPS